MKTFIRNTLNFLHLDITKNLKYDRLTKQIIKREIHPGSSIIDIGCHKGEIIDEALKYAPLSKHFGFEPLPDFFNFLTEKYKAKETIKLYNYALSDETTTTTFNYVKNAPAYSGMKKRKYDISNPDIEEIKVSVKPLDSFSDIFKENIKLIKIDVEGAEFLVLKGAKKLIKAKQPIIIFEFGLGASDFYDTSPEELFDFFSKELNMQIFTLANFLKSDKSLSKEELVALYNANKEYYFVAK